MSSAVDVEVAREELRVRADVHGTVGASFSGFAWAAGPGTSLEIGMIFADRFSVGARGTFASVLMLTTATLGVALEYAINDSFNIGVTPSFGAVGGIIFIADLPFSIAVFAPLRLTFAPLGPARSESTVQRRGFTLFVEAGPGFALRTSAGFTRSPPPTPSPVSLTVGLGIGYSTW